MKLKRAAAHNCDSRVFIKNYWSVLMADEEKKLFHRRGRAAKMFSC
jgi:hypothetical protein